MIRKPVLTSVPEATTRPKTQQTPEKRQWAFSLRYWRQYKDFGLGDLEARWFISLLERLKELSSLSVSDVMEDFNLRDGLRIHDIDWAATNIPIKRSDIDWVDAVYWNNPAEYPLIQFHISKALGRVAGFLDEHSVFNVVLLDPLHNLQPSKYNNYKIRATSFGECQLTTLVARVEHIVRKHRELSDEGREEILWVLREGMSADGRAILLLPVDREVIEAVDALIALGAHGEPSEYLMKVVEDAFSEL